MGGKSSTSVLIMEGKHKFHTTCRWQYTWSPVFVDARGCAKGPIVDADNHLVDGITTYPLGAHTGIHENLTTTTNSNGYGALISIFIGGSIVKATDGLLPRITADTSTLNIGTYSSLQTKCALGTAETCGYGAKLSV